MHFVEIEASRKQHGIPQVDLCREAGVHPASYSQMKSGKRDPRGSTLRKLQGGLSRLVAKMEVADA